MRKVVVKIHISREEVKTTLEYIDIKNEKHTLRLVNTKINTDTNNKTELKAVIEGLEHLRESCELEIYTYSDYIPGVINNKWYIKWINNNWKNAKGKSVANGSEWRYLLELLGKHNIFSIKRGIKEV